MGNESSTQLPKSTSRDALKQVGSFFKTQFRQSTNRRSTPLTPAESNRQKFIIDGNVGLISWQPIIDQLNVLLLCTSCFKNLSKPKQFTACKHIVCGDCAKTLQKCPLELDATGNFHPKFQTIESYKINTNLSSPQEPLASAEPWFFVSNIIERLPELISQLKSMFMQCEYKPVLNIIEEITDEFLCPICSGALGNSNSIAVKPCTHLMCVDCLQKWKAQGHNDCPYCKTEIQRRRVSYFSNQTEEVLDESPLGSFERFLLSQIPRLLLQLLTLATPSDVQTIPEYKNVRDILLDFIVKNKTLLNDYKIDSKQNAIIVEGLSTEMLNARVVPPEISEIGILKSVQNLTFNKSGQPVSIVSYKRTESAQCALALNDLYIQGFPVKCWPAPTIEALFEMQLTNALKLISVEYTKFEARYLPFIKSCLGKLDLPEEIKEITNKYFQYSAFEKI